MHPAQAQSITVTNPRSYEFLITTPDATYHLRAATKAELEAWTTHLDTARAPALAEATPAGLEATASTNRFYQRALLAESEARQAQEQVAAEQASTSPSPPGRKPGASPPGRKPGVLRRLSGSFKRQPTSSRASPS